MRFARALLAVQICLLSWLVFETRVQAQVGNAGVHSRNGDRPFGCGVSMHATIHIHDWLDAGPGQRTVTVEAAGDLLETDSTDVDRQLFDKLPLESTSSSVSSLVTLAWPGVAADSNGLFHGLGDHAENSFSVGQPITDH